MGSYTKKDLEHKLHIQHRNTRHDAIDIVLEYEAEINTFNEQLWQQCCSGPVFDPGGGMLKDFTIDQVRYNTNKRYFNPNELNRRLMNMKQRKPKEGE